MEVRPTGVAGSSSRAAQATRPAGRDDALAVLVVSIPEPLEREILALLAAPAELDAKLDDARGCRVCSLSAALARLTPLQARWLQRRILADAPSDELARQLRCLTDGDRRRVFALLDAARRQRTTSTPASRAAMHREPCGCSSRGAPA